MKIERIELRLRPIAARAFLRNQFRPIVRPPVRPGDGRRRRRPRATASASRTTTRTTRTKPPRPRGTSRRSFSRRASSKVGVRPSARGLRRVQGGPRAQHGEGRPRDGRLGSVREAAGRAAVDAVRRHAQPHRVRRARLASRTRWISSPRRWRRSWRPATGASRSRSSPAGTSTRSSTIRRRFGDIPLMVDANAAYTLADADHLGAARCLRT